MRRVAGMLLVLSAFAAAQQGWPDSLKESFARAVAAQRAGRLEEAERGFREVLRSGGNRAFVHNNLGIVCQQRGDHIRALAELQEAVRMDPRYAQPRILMGVSLLALGRITEAIKRLTEAVRLAPDEPLAHLELAKAYQRGEQPELALDEFRVLVRLAPREPEYAYLLGKAYTTLSEQCYSQLVRRARDSARVYQLLAESYREQGQIERAIKAFEQAARADEKLPGIHLDLARLYMQQGRSAEASAAVDAELAIMPESQMALALQRTLKGQ